MRKTAIVLLITGIILTFINGISWLEKRENKKDGKIEMNTIRNEHFYLHPFIGVILLTGGSLLLFRTKEQNKKNRGR